MTLTNKNIVLVGFMGSGKSTAAKKLGQTLNRRVISSDEMIVAKEGRAITEIFKDSGEPFFRQVEKNVVREIAEMDNVVIDCGGGVVLDPENVDTLKQNGIVFYLSSTPDCIYQCIKSETHRPLLNVSDPKARIKELLDARAPFYARADVNIQSNDRTIDAICEEIIQRMSNEPS